MATSFPTGLDALTNPVSTDTLASPSHADQHANVNDAVEALEAKVGVDGSAVTSSLDYRVRNIDATTAIVSGSSSGDLVRITQTGSGNALVVEDSANPDSTPLVVDASGNVVIGQVSTSITSTGVVPKLQVVGLNNNHASSMIYNFANDGTTSNLTFAKSRGGSLGTQGAAVNADSIGNLFFEASDGTQLRRSAQINVSVDGSVSSAIVPGRITLHTMSTAGTLTERMRINSAGLVGIGVVPTSMLHVVNTTAANKAFIVKGAASQSGDLLDVQNSDGTSQFKVDASGYVGIGTETPFQPASYGALTIDGSGGHIISGRVAGTETFRIQSSSLSTTINAIATAPLIFNTTNTERMRINSAGLVGIGVVPTSMLHVVNTTAANKAFIVKGAASQSGSLFDIQNSAGTSLVVVNSAGNLVIGSGTAVASISGVTSSNQVLGSSAATSSMLLSRYSADANGPSIYFGKSRNATVGSHTANTSGDRLGNINFNGSDGTNFVGASSISADSEGTISTGVVPGRLLFFTANSAGTLTERMRITSAGDVGIGTNTPTSKLHVVGSFSRGAPVTKTASFTLADTENWIICNGTASITVTLPAASTQVGREISLKNTAAFTVVSASSNIVPLAGGAAGTAILPATAGSWATLVSDGTNWVIMQS